MGRFLFGICYRTLVKPVLFLFSPETMHTVFWRIGYVLWSLRLTKRITHLFFNYTHAWLSQTVRWYTFPNPVGLAAWFDKDIQLPNIIDAVWFGRTEVGSITYKPYTGNPGKRLFRLIKSQGLLVNYGLKNAWALRAKQRLLHTQCKVPLFVSIAKTNCIETCDLQKGIQDYVASLDILTDVAQVQGCVLNISCPNAFGWEDYTSPERLHMLLEAVCTGNSPKPYLVKLPIDKTRQEIKLLVEVCIDFGIRWVIISNLTKQRATLVDAELIAELPGGVSGKPTQSKSDFLIGEVYKCFWKQIVIVGVGWIFCPQDAYHKIRQWASLVQLITGMIFQWPQLIGEINAWLVILMQQDGFTHISQAIGANFRN